MKLSSCCIWLNSGITFGVLHDSQEIQYGILIPIYHVLHNEEKSRNPEKTGPVAKSSSCLWPSSQQAHI